MVKSGYTLIEQQINVAKTNSEAWLSPSFELDATTPDNLAVFFHIEFSLVEGTIPQKILMSKNDGVSYQPLSNNSDVDGWFYRSGVMTKSNKINFKIVGTAVTLSDFVLMLEE